MIQKILKFINSCKSAYLTGRAFKMIEQGNYGGGAALLEKLCQNDKKDNPEYLYFRLGDCYYRMQKYSKAVKWLKKSLDSYKLKIPANQNRPNFYNDVKDTYMDALKLNGQHELAKIIKTKNVDHG